MRRQLALIVLMTLAGSAGADDEPKAPPAKEPELRAELLRRVKADQDVRGELARLMQPGIGKHADEADFEKSLDATRKAEFDRLGKAMQRIDTENTRRMEEIVDRYGWPTYALVGKDGSNAAWLLVQHADLSPKFQRKCLDLMTGAPRGEINPGDLAYLTDRVLLAEGKKQVYGTQFTLHNGKCKPRPLEDEANVDQRRKEAGLEPLADYYKQAESFYGGPKK